MDEEGLMSCNTTCQQRALPSDSGQAAWTYGLVGVLVSCSVVVVPLGAVWGGRGDPGWDPAGLDAGLQVSEVRGGRAPLPNPAVGPGEVGALVTEGERTAGGSGEAEEDRTSGRFWQEERRFFRPSCSPAAIFLLSLRR